MYLGVSEDVSRAKTNNSLKFHRDRPCLSAQMYLVLSKSGIIFAEFRGNVPDIRLYLQGLERHRSSPSNPAVRRGIMHDGRTSHSPSRMKPASAVDSSCLRGVPPAERLRPPLSQERKIRIVPVVDGLHSLRAHPGLPSCIAWCCPTPELPSLSSVAYWCFDDSHMRK
jgi:hypothetical protein